MWLSRRNGGIIAAGINDMIKDNGRVALHHFSEQYRFKSYWTGWGSHQKHNSIYQFALNEDVLLKSSCWIHKKEQQNCCSHAKNSQEEWISAMKWLNGWSNRKNDYRRWTARVQKKENSRVHLKANELAKRAQICLFLIKIILFQIP